jgi:hypothetical protein
VFIRGVTSPGEDMSDRVESSGRSCLDCFGRGFIMRGALSGMQIKLSFEVQFLIYQH